MDPSKQEGGPGIGRVIVVATLLGAAGFLYYMFRAPKIPAEFDAMKPDYEPGARVLVNLRASGYATGDIVYYSYEYADERHEQIGRIAGAPGDKVVLDLANKRIHDQVKDREPGPGGTLLGTLPEDKFYLLDNEKEESWYDSRTFGLVPRAAIKGKVVRTLPF